MHVTARVVVATIAALWMNGAGADGAGTGANSWIGYVFGGNFATALSSAVVAGSNNVASAQGAFAGAGTANRANGISSLVIGGFDNSATAIDALVGAGAGNRASGVRSIIVGGGYNLASGHFSFIGGGGRSGEAATPAGTNPDDNVAGGNSSVIGGGQGNRAGVAGNESLTAYSTISGGLGNTASGPASTIGGGQLNRASGSYASVTGGTDNTASGYGTTISGGAVNGALGTSATVVGGYNNIASGNYAVAGGFTNLASGDGSVAMGAKAQANGHGCFVFGDVSTTNPVQCNADNRVVFRAVGGIYMFTGGSMQNAYTGVALAPGGQAWIAQSDRAGKENIVAVETRDVLAKVVALPIATWNWKSQDAAIRHMGPMAQDFRDAFGLGETEKGISTIDSDGVALAAIQGLHALVQETQETVRARDARINALTAEMAELRRAVDVLLARSSLDAQVAQR